MLFQSDDGEIMATKATEKHRKKQYPYLYSKVRQPLVNFHCEEEQNDEAKFNSLIPDHWIAALAATDILSPRGTCTSLYIALAMTRIW